MVVHAGGADQERKRQSGSVPLHLQGHNRLQTTHRGRDHQR